jgi:hypothetical protein
MADAPISYGLVIGVFIGLAMISFAARAKRLSGRKEFHPDKTGEETKRSPA